MCVRQSGSVSIVISGGARLHMLTPARSHICSTAIAETAAVVVPRRAPRRLPRRSLRTSTARKQARSILSLISASPPQARASTDSHPACDDWQRFY